MQRFIDGLLVAAVALEVFALSFLVTEHFRGQTIYQKPAAICDETMHKRPAYKREKLRHLEAAVKEEAKRQRRSNVKPFELQQPRHDDALR